ncbi:MAG: sigma-70 family RNA polymerase sigma factor [Planctomycetes bacterium]|nr:sigma-70 family RNA polymerase sigma factor [Planctomycetota bacterium]
MHTADVEHLLNAVRAGEPEAFRGLVQALSEPLFRYVSSIVRDPQTAQDVIQQTFIRLFRSRGKLQTGGTLRGYCYRMASNLAKNALRDDKLRRAREGQAMPTHTQSGDPLQAAMAREAWQLVHNLPDDLKEPLLLRFEHGLTLAETADTLSVPEGTVSTRQRSALERLRERLGVSLALPVGIDLADLLGKAQTPFTPVAVPTSLAYSVETAVMAAIGTKTLSGTAIAIILLLLLAGGGTGAFFLHNSARAQNAATQANNEPETIAVKDVAGTRDRGGENARDTRKDSGATVAKTPADSGTTTMPKAERTPPDVAGPIPAPAPTARTVKAKISGRVTDKALKGIAGVDVQAFGPSYIPQLLWDVEGGTTLDRPSGSAITDDNGRYSLDLSVITARLEGPVYFVLHARAAAVRGARPEFAAAKTRDLWVLDGVSQDGVDIVMSRPAKIHGVVVYRGTDKPVAGIEVSLGSMLTGNSRSLPFIMPETHTRKTGADGLFVFDGIAEGDYSVAIVNKLAGRGRDHADYHAENLMLSGSATVAEGLSAGPITLQYDGALLTFKTSPPVASVQVEAMIIIPGSEPVGPIKMYYYLSPTADGRFIMAGLHPGVSSIALTTNRGSAVCEFSPVEGKDLDLGVVTLAAANAVTGRVIGPEGALAGVSVTATKQGSSETKYSHTESAGEFMLDLAPGAWQILATHRTHGQGRATVTVAAGQPADVTITLTASCSGLRGKVTVAGRAPTAGELGATGAPQQLEVHVIAGKTAGGAEIRSRYYAIVDHLGRYEVAFVPPGSWTVAVRLGDRTSVRNGVDVRENAVTEADINLAAGGLVYGRVLDREGKPASGLKISLGRYSLTTYSYSSELDAVVNPDGNYRFEDVAAGSYYLRVAGDGELMSATQLASRAVNIAEGAKVEKNLDFSQSAGSGISGRATVGGKSEFKEAVLLKCGDMASMRSAAIDKEGNFELANVEPGVYYLWFADNKYHPKRFFRETVTVDKDNPSVRVERDYPAASLSGTVRLAAKPDGFSYTKVKVRLSHVLDDSAGVDPVAMMASWTLACDAEGRFKADLLAGGKYLITATAPDMPPVSQEQVLDGAKVVDFTLGGKSGTLHLVVKDILGEDTAGPIVETSVISGLMLLTLRDAKGKDVPFTDGQRLPTFAKGAAQVVPSLPAGEYGVELVGMHMEKWSGSATIKEGETTNLDVTLQRAATIKLKVNNAELDAATVQKAKVQVFDADNKLVPLGADLTSAFGIEPETAAGKAIKLSPLPGGTYRIVVTLEGYQPLEVYVTVARSSNLEQEITLVR